MTVTPDTMEQWMRRVEKRLLAVERKPQGTMHWRGAYLAGQCYERGSLVTDDGYLMLAKRETCEKPAPSPVGAPFYVFDGTLAAQTPPTVKQIIVGTRYSYAQGGYVTGYRVHATAGQRYTVYSLLDGVFRLWMDFLATATGWAEFAVAPVVLAGGSTLDVLVVVRAPDTSAPTAFSADWSYVTPPKSRVPKAGEVVHPNEALQTMSFSATDADGTDRSAALLALSAGDRVTVQGQQYQVIGVTDQTTYVDLTVSPPIQAVSDQRSTFTMETTAPTPVAYSIAAGHYAGNAEVTGLVALDGVYENLATTDDAHGVDLQVQEGSFPEDWSLLSAGTAPGGPPAIPTVEPPALLVCRLNSMTLNNAQGTFSLTGAHANDSAGVFTLGSNSITVNVAGYYRISFMVEFTNPLSVSNNDSRYVIYVREDGSEIGVQRLAVPDNGPTGIVWSYSLAATFCEYIEAGADITVSAYAENAGGALPIADKGGSPANQVSIEKIRELA